MAKVTRIRAFTDSQSRPLRCPITVNSERWAVKTYARKQDCARTCRLPVLEDGIGRALRPGQLRGENRHHSIRTLGEVRRARDHHGWPDLGFLGADQYADHHIARRQSRSSDSSASRRRREAALNSFRSSSVQESDQSILWFGASSANRSASADNSVAASGGKRRKASTNEASRSLSCISIFFTQYTAKSSP